jgi:serine/threonine protein kinase
MPDGPSFPTLPVLDTKDAGQALPHAGAVVADLGMGAPRRIGPYEITGVLGSGGMGVVYRAEQQEPLRREVALKLIRRGLDTDRLIGRFEAERLALARMSHSGIARVFDAGATDDGRPYFVMELVAGAPIVDYCDERRLPVRDRLALFVAACRAVQHAHQKGIIHRDLKPSNILVSEDEGPAIPKIIDFGVAKAVSEEEGDRAWLTRDGQFVGTPEYMSPEQAGVIDADVDTRADVYALGVVLYELLAGRTPHRFTQGTHDELREKLRDVPPVRPSTAIGGPRRGRFTPAAPVAPEAWAVIAEARRTTSDRLRRLLEGDLDTIVLKAMAFDPSRRYASIEQLAEDVERYLRSEAVLARPDSVAYRTRKFVGRHRYAVTAATGAALLLVGFSAVTAVQSARVARERDRAEQALARAAAVNRFLVGMFEQADPRLALGAPPSAEQMLERAAVRLQTDLRDEPDVRAELLQSLADVYKQLGRYDRSERLNVEAVALRRGGDALVLADSLDALGDVRRYAGRTDAAVAPLEEALTLRRRWLPRGHRDVAETLNNLALVRHAQGRYGDAEGLQRQAVSIWEHLDAREPGEDLVALGLTNLGRTVRAQGRSAEATALFQRALDLRRRHLPPNSPRIATSLYFLGLTRLDGDRPRDALVLFEQSVRNRLETLGPAHPQTLQVRVQLARTHGLMGEHAAAAREADAVLAAAAGVPDASRAVLAEADLVLANAALATGRSAEAQTLLARARARSAAGAPTDTLSKDLARLTARLEAR